MFLIYENRQKQKPSTQAKIEIVFTTSVGDTLVHNSLVSPDCLLAGVWTHVICSCNPSKEICLYINGQLAKKVPIDGTLVWSTARPLNIGAPKVSEDFSSSICCNKKVGREIMLFGVAV